VTPSSTAMINQMTHASTTPTFLDRGNEAPTGAWMAGTHHVPRRLSSMMPSPATPGMWTLRSLPLIGAVGQVVHSTDVLEQFTELPPPLHARDQL